MKNSSILVTGAAGEIGTALIPQLVESEADVVALDLNPDYQSVCKEVKSVTGDICDQSLISHLFKEHKFDVVYHFAGLLSSAAERQPFISQRVNIEGTCFLLQCAYESGKEHNSATRFMFTSSIGAYGATDRSLLRKAITEDQCLSPESLYGIQKLFTEQLGAYFTRRSSGQFLDFQCLRYPGIISIETLPTGGTSDYGAEMLHSAHDGKPYSCFVSEDSILPFMTMPDAIRAMIGLASAPHEQLSRRVYNVRGFAVTAKELRDEVLLHYPNAQIDFDPVEWRDDVINSWPDDIDDSLAKGDWGWKPEHDFKRAFTDYFLPGLVSQSGKEVL